jgi:hypothetical protein
MALTASIIPSPGVNIRPFTILNVLVSGRLFCRPWSRWSPAHDPIICASTEFHSKHDKKKSNDCGKEDSGVIAQQR